MNTYLLDANVLINAHRTVYPMQVAPGFWEWIKLQADIGTLTSIDSVKDELLNPDLREWVEELTPSFFQPTSDDIFPALTQVSDWVNHQSRYTPSAKRTFEESTDRDLIAHALLRRQTVVTYEVQSPRAKSTIKIPDVCKELGVRYTTLSRVLIREGARFVLDDTVRQSLEARRSSSLC